MFEHHFVRIGAAADVAYRSVLSAPLAASPIVRALLRLRELPAAALGQDCHRGVSRREATVADLIGNGFFLVDEQPGREIVLGAVGKFWKPLDRGMGTATAESLTEPLPPGTAVALWNFRVAREAGRSVVHTETRIKCADASARRKFKLYWSIVGPFSGLIRRKMLDAIKCEAEAARLE